MSLILGQTQGPLFFLNLHHPAHLSPLVLIAHPMHTFGDRVRSGDGRVFDGRVFEPLEIEPLRRRLWLSQIFKHQRPV